LENRARRRILPGTATKVGGNGARRGAILKKHHPGDRPAGGATRSIVELLLKHTWTTGAARQDEG
jgi:hypothetical protein